jgi:serine O-acetyltransferase
MNMKFIAKIYRALGLALNAIRLAPHLVLWRLSPRRGLIDQDLRRWSQAFLRRPGGASDFLTFLLLMVRFPEYRTLFYHRLGAAAALARFLCPPLPLLSLVCGEVGPGLVIQHGFASIIVARRIGANCWVNQQVTIGSGPKPGFPTLGDDVRIAPGAKVLGGVTIGDRSTVGANAVVTKDVPPDVTVVGVPAYIIRRDGRRVREDL